MEPRKHRRPAIIEPETLEYLEGEEDPALSTQAAHTSARTLVSAPDGQWTDPDRETREKLAAYLQNEGVDGLAELWANAPSNTLPGALWRLMLIRLWVNKDVQRVRSRYADGMACPSLDKLIDPQGAKTLDLDQWIQDLDLLARGKFEEDFAHLLSRSQAVLRVLAACTKDSDTWVEKGDELATEVTTRSSALLRTADELDEASELYRQGRLD